MNFHDKVQSITDNVGSPAFYCSPGFVNPWHVCINVCLDEKEGMLWSLEREGYACMRGDSPEEALNLWWDKFTDGKVLRIENDTQYLDISFREGKWVEVGSGKMEE